MSGNDWTSLMPAGGTHGNRKPKRSELIHHYLCALAPARGNRLFPDKRGGTGVLKLNVKQTIGIGKLRAMLRPAAAPSARAREPLAWAETPAPPDLPGLPGVPGSPPPPAEGGAAAGPPRRWRSGGAAAGPPPGGRGAPGSDLLARLVLLCGTVSYGRCWAGWDVYRSGCFAKKGLVWFGLVWFGLGRFGLFWSGVA
eukprot:gene21077-biopygen8616